MTTLADVGAFDAWYARSWRMLVRVAARLLPGPDAEDVVQDVVLDVRTRMTAAAGAPPLRSEYVLRAVQRRCFDFLKHRRRAESPRVGAKLRDRYPNDDSLSMDDPADAILTSIDADPTMRVLRDAIAALPQRQREVLLLRWRRGATFREIGTALGMSAKTAQEHMRRAGLALAAHLPGVTVKP
jgi:RNA polymerase sigma factor (sigma-70 family)